MGTNQEVHPNQGNYIVSKKEETVDTNYLVMVPPFSTIIQANAETVPKDDRTIIISTPNKVPLV